LLTSFIRQSGPKLTLLKQLFLALLLCVAGAADVVVAAAGNATCNNSNYIEHSCAKQNNKKK